MPSKSLRDPAVRNSFMKPMGLDTRFPTTENTINEDAQKHVRTPFGVVQRGGWLLGEVMERRRNYVHDP